MSTSLSSDSAMADALALAPSPNSSRVRRQLHPTKWVYNDKIKTCKCTICGLRVQESSLKCDSCGIHICSECQDLNSDRQAVNKIKARHHLDNGCWPCSYPSNMHPGFAKRYLDYQKQGLKEDVLEKDLQALMEKRKKSLQVELPRSRRVVAQEGSSLVREKSSSAANSIIGESSVIAMRGRDVAAPPCTTTTKRKRSQVDDIVPEWIHEVKPPLTKYMRAHANVLPTIPSLGQTLLLSEGGYRDRVDKVKESKVSAFNPTWVPNIIFAYTNKPHIWSRARSAEPTFRIPPRWV